MPSSDDKYQSQENMSSDDEPITKYAKDYDSGVDLSEDVKLKIRKEVTRVLKDKLINHHKVKLIETDQTKTKRKKSLRIDRHSKRIRAAKIDTENDKISEVIIMGPENNVPDLVFADVNEVKDENYGAGKSELEPSMTSVISGILQFLLY